MSLVKISFAANELGVSQKTIYNWVKDGKLSTAEPGYVDLKEARAVWVNQQLLRVEISFFMSKGTIRDAYGRFSGKPKNKSN